MADVLAVTVTVALVLNVDKHRLALLLLAMPLVIVPFKIAGLYDRDDVLLVRSTLDELPALMQLTALFALGVAIVKWLLGKGNLGGRWIAGLRLGSLTAIVICRASARWLAGQLSQIERCLVIGELERAQRISERIGSSRARAVVVASLPVTTEDIEELEGSDAIHRLVRELEVDRMRHRAVHKRRDRHRRADPHRKERRRPCQCVAANVRGGRLGGRVRGRGRDDDARYPAFRPVPVVARWLKRGFDLASTTLGLLLAAPIMVRDCACGPA